MGAFPKENESYNQRIDDSIKELERRMYSARRARFACAARLRKYFNKVQNLIIYYNIMVVIISIISLFQLYNEKAAWITYVTLSLSISLSFFATHIGGKNYKERAILMENNGHDLSKVQGKIEMIRLQRELAHREVANLYKEYEQVLEKVENHETIDYLQVKKNNKTASEEEQQEFDQYFKSEKRLFTFAYGVPVLLVAVMLLFPIFL